MSEKELLEKLKKMPEVSGYSLNYVVHAFNDEKVTPNDPKFSNLWGMTAINAQQAWKTSIGDNNIYSVIIDTGIDYNHEDLKDNFETNGYSRNFVSEISDPKAYKDENGHGTHVAGTIGAVGDNNIGVAGVNWNVKLIALRVLDANGSGYTSDICNAIDYVTGLLNDNPNLKIASVNLSLGGYRETTPQEMMDTQNFEWKAYSLLSQTNRTVICVAAGNEGLEVGKPVPYTGFFQGRFLNEGTYCYPASLIGINNLIVVASATSSKTRSDFSNYSSEQVDITAPGSIILSSTPGNNYEYYSGTSMATPHVAGAAALLMSINPDATAYQIKEALLEGADKNYCVADGTSVNGFLDLAKAIEYLDASGNDEPAAPVITTTELPDATDGKHYINLLKATGSRPMNWEISDGSLPEGFTLNSTGSINGTPTYTGKTAYFTVKASNAYGSDTKALSLYVQPLSPNIKSETLANVIINSPYSHTFSAFGTEPITWNVAEGSSLPTGLTLSSTGTLSGTPTKAGQYEFSIKTSNIGGTDTESFSLLVASDPAILTETLSTASIGSYGFSFEGIGSGNLTWSIEDGKLPGNLQLSSYGYLGGYLSQFDEGRHKFTVKLESSKGSATKEFTLLVGNYPRIMEKYLPGGIVGEEYNYSLKALGTGPFTWSLEEGSSLPDGLTLSSNGTLKGTPTSEGDFWFTVRVSNAISYTSEELALFVRSKSSSDIKITTKKIPTAIFGEPFSYQLEADGTKPIKWEGDVSFIRGLTVSESGLISGTPLRDFDTHTGSLTYVTFTASNSTGSAERTIAVEADVKPIISTSELSSGTVGNFYYETFYAYEDLDAPIYSGDVSPERWGWVNPVTWTITAGKIPEGLSLDVFGHLAGTPTNPGKYNFTVQASVSGVSSTKDFTLTIGSGAPSITTESLKNAYRQQYYYENIYADGNQPFTWEISAGQLPDGLTLESYSGYAYICGEPTTYGDYTFTVKASNSSGYDTKQYTINVSERAVADVDFNMYYHVDAKILNGKTVYDDAKFSYMSLYLNKVYDNSQSSLERAEAKIIRENEERQRALSEGRNPKDISGVNAIISNDDGKLIIEDAFTIEAGPLGYYFSNGGYVEPNTAVTYDLIDNGYSYSPYKSQYIYLHDSSDVAMKNREMTWEFPAELSHLNGGITLNKLRSVEDQLETAVPYFEFIKPNSDGKFTAVKYRLVKASDTSKAVSLGFDGIVNFYSSGEIQSGDATQWVSLFSYYETVSADHIVEGEKELDTPVSYEDLAYAYAYGDLYDGNIRYYWYFDFVLPPYIYTDEILPDATVGEYYYQYISHRNSVDSWDIVNGSLPEGLELAEYGYIYGTPQESGTFTFTIRASNAVGTASKEFTLIVQPAKLPSSLKMRTNFYAQADLVNGKSSYENVNWHYISLSLSSQFDENSANGHYEMVKLEDGRKIINFVRDDANTVSDGSYKFIPNSFTIEAGSGDYYCSGQGLVDGSKANTIGIRYWDDGYSYRREYYPAVTSQDYQSTFYDSDEAFKNRKFTWKLNDELAYINGSTTLTKFRSINDQFKTAIPYVELAKPNADGKFTALKWRLVKKNNTSKAVALGYDADFSLQVGVISDDGNDYWDYVYVSLSSDVPAEGEIELSYPAPVKNVQYVYASLYSDTINYTWYLERKINAPEIHTQELPEGYSGQDYDFWFDADGETPINWSLTKGELPKGLSLDESGNLFGTPLVSGTYNFSVKASNSYGEDEREFVLNVYAKPKITTGATLKSGTLGTSYTVTLKAEGTAKLKWSLKKGSLPDGLSLKSSSGKITGTPTKEGTFKFTVRVKNDYGQDSKNFSITVGTKPSFSTKTLTNGTVGKNYSLTMKAKGTKSFTWSICSGALPDGLKLNSSTGKISGTPKKEGVYEFKVKLKNDFGSAYRTFTLTIGLKPKISTGATLKTGTKGTKYSTTLKASGTAPLRWSKYSGTLPKGIKLNKNTGKLSGTPTKTGKFTFKIKVSNDYGTHTKNFTVTIKSASSKSSSSAVNVKESSEKNTGEVQNLAGGIEINAAVNLDAQQDVDSLINTAKTEDTLHVIDNDGEPSANLVKISSGQDLLFEIDTWYNSCDDEDEVSEVKVYVNDEALDVEIQEDGTFILDACEAGEEFVVYVKAVSPSGEEIKSNEIYIVIE